MGDQLPPFAIRQLRNREPYSVLQVTEAQYQIDVEDYPDTVLSYLDDDDGEKVTVGSSLELKQRLEEMPPPTAPMIHCYNSGKDAFEDRLIHLFDVQKTNASRSVWRTQLRQYKKSRKQHEKALKQKLDDDSISSIDLNAESQVTQDEQNSNLGVNTDHQPNTQPAFEPKVAAALSDAIPDLVDSLAKLMETTSETLRKAAQKSRQSKTTPIEDVLSGVSNIVNEIGTFGLSLLDTLNDTSEMHDSKHACSVSEISSPSEVMVPTLSSEVKNSVNQEESNQVEHTDMMASSSVSKQDTSQKRTFGIQERICTFCSNFKLQCRGIEDGSGTCHNCATIGHTCSLTTQLADSAPHMSTSRDQASQPTPMHLRDGSILDQDTEDADFSRRYPPLISLRRANTIAGLHDRFTTPREQGVNDHGLVRHGSWIKRYPHRPVPYVLDAETQRRRDFARHCFPAQKYTPGPGVKDGKVQPLRKDTSHIKPLFRVPQHRSDAFEKASTSTNTQVQEVEVKRLSLDNVAKPASDPVGGVTNVTTLLTDSKVPYKPVHTALPGAWPESEGRLPANTTLGESSGAFFYRMMRDNPSRKRDHALETSERLTRHRSFSKQKPNNNPFNELNRSRTVASNANPASRLNRPFEPLYPDLAPITKEWPQIKSIEVRKRDEATKNDTVEPQTKLPERSQPWTQRPFSPVWEEHFNKVKEHSDRADKNDQNKDFDSMYSPPPRHMRSVPNFASAAKAVTFHVPPAPVVASSSSATIERVVKNVPESSLLSTAPVAPAMPFQVLFAREPPRSPPKQTAISETFQPRSTQQVIPSEDIFFDTTTHRGTDPERFVPGTRLAQCLTTLRDMGYGLDNDNLASRLHVYVTAADGDVMDAVEMIEDDKKANFGRVAEDQLRRRKPKQRFVM